MTAFSPRKKSSDGFASRCRECRQATRPKAREAAQRVARYHAGGEKSLVRQREYQDANREKYRAASQKWRGKNPEKQKIAQRRWAEENPHKNAAAAQRYYTRKRNRTPLWLTEKDWREIETFYQRAAELTAETGIKHVVDHVVPLHGKRISGLHCPGNLQVITAAENLAKSNNWPWPKEV